MHAPFGFVSVCVGLELTAVTIPFIDRIPFPGRSTAERDGSSLPLSRVLERGEYLRLEPGAAGVIESRVFPGLRLAVAALLAGDLPTVLDTQQRS